MQEGIWRGFPEGWDVLPSPEGRNFRKGDRLQQQHPSCQCIFEGWVSLSLLFNQPSEGVSELSGGQGANAMTE